jgi:hypothetical protein
VRRKGHGDVLVRGVEQEDKCNNRVSSASVAGVREVCGHCRLQGKEHDHATDGSQEKNPSTDPIDHRGGTESPEQVPDLKETVNEKL